MNAFAALLLAVSSPGPSDVPDRTLLEDAEKFFAEGVARRSDERAARSAFARSATAYDELWQRGNHKPELALNRASAHRLAGNLPRAIAALDEGLAGARWSRPLQNALEEARSAVGYPHDSDLELQCRPKPPTTIGTRLSPLDALVIGGGLWLLACAGIARFVMTRVVWWGVFASIGAIALAAFGAAWIIDRRECRREASDPLVIVARDVVLRKGNAEAYPPRFDGQQRLPAGVEARFLARRGGWMQIRLAGGAIGWIPESAALKTDVGPGMIESERP